MPNKSVDLLSALGSFKFRLKKHGKLFEPYEAIRQILEISELHDIPAKPLAQLIASQEPHLRDAIVPFESTISRDYSQTYDRRVKMMRDYLPRWMKMNKRRYEKLWDAYDYFVKISLGDICYIRYNQRLPQPETVLGRIREVSEKFDVDPDRLFGRLHKSFFPDWNILCVNYSPIYQNLADYFVREDSHEVS